MSKLPSTASWRCAGRRRGSTSWAFLSDPQQLNALASSPPEASVFWVTHKSFSYFFTSSTEQRTVLSLRCASCFTFCRCIGYPAAAQAFFPGLWRLRNGSLAFVVRGADQCQSACSMCFYRAGYTLTGAAPNPERHTLLPKKSNSEGLSDYLNMEVSGPKYYAKNGFWGSIPSYLGTWTLWEDILPLRVQVPKSELTPNHVYAPHHGSTSCPTFVYFGPLP